MADTVVEQSHTNQTPLAIMAAFLTQEGWPCEQVGEQILRTRFKGNHGEWLCLAHCRPEAAQYIFYSVAPLRVPAVLRPAVAEYLTRANWGLILGNFELDYEDGEVRFKTSVELGGLAPAAAILRPLFFGNVAVMDQYLPGLQAVIALQKTPAEAIESVESPQN